MEDIGIANPPPKTARARLVIRAVSSSKDLRNFIDFPYGLYRGNPCYVPPLKGDEKITLQQTTNLPLIIASRGIGSPIVTGKLWAGSQAL